MAGLGSLVVTLSANTAQFTSAMDKAAYQAGQRMEQMRKNAKMAGAAIGAAFVVGAGAAAVLVKQAIDSADEMAKMAQKAGVSAESFSTLAYAAGLSGVEVGSLQAAMSRLGMTASDVARGANKDAAAAFAALGISVTDASGQLKSSDTIMSEVAGRFVNMEDGAGKTALAMKVFGKSGADLIPMLNAGSEGLSAMQAEARALGVEMDGTTGPAAERFNDNLSRLNTLKKGFANQIMKAVLPALEGLTNRMIDSAKSSGGLEKAARAAAAGMKILMSVGAIVTGVFQTLGEYIGGVAATLMLLFSGQFKAAFETGKSVVSDYAKNIEGTLGTVKAIWDESADAIESDSERTSTKVAAPLIRAAEKAKKANKIIQSEAEKAFDAVEKAIDAIDMQADTYGKSEAVIGDWKLMLMGATDAQRAHAAGVYEFIDAKKREAESMEEGVRITREMLTPMEQYQQRLVELGTLLQQNAISYETYSRAIGAAQVNFDKLNKTGVDSMRELQKAAEGWGSKFTDTFVDGIMKGKLSFKELADSVIADILRIIVQKQVLNALGDFGGDGKSGAGLLGAVSTIGSTLFGGGKALGGDVDAGTSYLVGERGPERFTPKLSGTITPNESTVQPLTVIQNFTVGDVASISMVRQAVANSEKRISGAMGRSMNYGGALS